MENITAVAEQRAATVPDDLGSTGEGKVVAMTMHIRKGVPVGLRDRLHELTGAEAKVLLCHILHSNKTDESYLSAETLSAETGLNRDTVYGAHSSLQRKGWLLKTGEHDNKGRWKVPVFKLVWNPDGETPSRENIPTAMSENIQTVMPEKTETVKSPAEVSSALLKKATSEGARDEADLRSTAAAAVATTEIYREEKPGKQKSEQAQKMEVLSGMTEHEKKILVIVSKALDTGVNPDSARRIAAVVTPGEADLFAEWLPKVNWLLKKSAGRPDWLADRLESANKHCAIDQFRRFCAGRERYEAMADAHAPTEGLSCNECECTNFPTFDDLREHYEMFHGDKVVPGAYLEGEVDLDEVERLLNEAR